MTLPDCVKLKFQLLVIVPVKGKLKFTVQLIGWGVVFVNTTFSQYACADEQPFGVSVTVTSLDRSTQCAITERAGRKTIVTGLATVIEPRKCISSHDGVGQSIRTVDESNIKAASVIHRFDAKAAGA
jgi:hypothetical protein